MVKSSHLIVMWLGWAFYFVSLEDLLSWFLFIFLDPRSRTWKEGLGNAHGAKARDYVAISFVYEIMWKYHMCMFNTDELKWI